MKKKDNALMLHLRNLLERRRLLPSQLAAELGLSHTTVSRWLSGAGVPGIRSCQRLAEYSGVPVEKILFIAGHLPKGTEKPPTEWPEFREYARNKYPAELDEDLIIMIEDLIERRRAKKRRREKPLGGNLSSGHT